MVYVFLSYVTEMTMPQVHPYCCRWQDFILFVTEQHSTAYVYHTYWWTLAASIILAIVNKAAVFSLGKYSEVRLLDHRVILFFNFLRTLHAAFHCGCTNSHYHQLCARVPFSLHPCQILLFTVCLTVAFLTGVRCHCGFDLYFFDDWWCWASSDVSVGPYVRLLLKISLPVLCPFYNWVVIVLNIELYDFFVHFSINPQET